MHLEDQAEAPVLEARHEIYVPQRPRAVQRLRQQLVGQPAEPLQRHGSASLGGHGHVVGDVEEVVVHPGRLRQSQRREREPLAEARDAREPRGDLRPEGLDRRRRNWAGGRLEKAAPSDVHVGVRGLEPQERAIEMR